MESPTNKSLLGKDHLNSFLSRTAIYWSIWTNDASLHCRRILGGRNLVRVRNVVVAAIFDFMTVEDWGE